MTSKIDKKSKHTEMVCFPLPFKAEVKMKNRQPEQISSEQQTLEASTGPQYMPLVKARQSSRSLEAKPTSSSLSVSQYASPNPSTCSYEILRLNVTIEKIIGKGAFGQVAKGKVKGLHGKPHVTQVAIKMLKGTRYFLNWFITVTTEKWLRKKNDCS